MSAGPTGSLYTEAAWFATLLGIGSKPGMIVTQPIVMLLAGRHCSLEHPLGLRVGPGFAGGEAVHGQTAVGWRGKSCLLSQLGHGSLWRRRGENWQVLCARVPGAGAGRCG